MPIDLGESMPATIQVYARLDVHDAMVMRDLLEGAGFTDFAELLTYELDHRTKQLSRGWARFVHDAMVMRDLLEGAGFTDFAELLTYELDHRTKDDTRGESANDRT